MKDTILRIKLNKKIISMVFAETRHQSHILIILKNQTFLIEIRAYFYKCDYAVTVNYSSYANRKSPREMPEKINFAVTQNFARGKKGPVYQP